MKKWQLAIFFAVSAVALSAGLMGLHWYLSRPDRIAAHQEQDNLRLVRDELLRYEDEHGTLPPSLETLIPAYLQAGSLTATDGSSRFAYDVERRRIAAAQGYKIRGLYSYVLAPEEYILPPLQMPPHIATLPPHTPPTLPTPPTPVTQVMPTPPLPLPPGPEPVVLVQPEPPIPVEPPVQPVQPVQPEPPAVEPGPPIAAKELVVPEDPGYAAPPKGSLVFEAEQYSDTNYGWEIHPDPKAAGGAYLHCKEGIANGPAQTEYNAGNFYDVKGTKDVTALRYYFHLETAGKYYIYGRMWTTDTHCSNNLAVAVDKGGPYIGGMENRTPFRWLWAPVAGGPFRLSKGDHYLHIFIHEDGIRVDQYILSPVRVAEDAPAYKANFATGKNTAFVAEKGPGVALAYDLKSMIFTPAQPVDCSLTIRSVRPMSGRGRLKTVLQGGGLDGGELAVADVEVDLAQLPEVSFLPLSFKDLAPEKLPRREFILQTELLVDGAPVATCRIPLIRPYAWEFFGPGGFLRQQAAGPLDGLGQPKPEDKRTWQQFSDRNFDHFGVLDFGVQFDGNMKHPRENATVYAQTRVEIPQTETYLLKIQADDQMILWVDGKEIYRHDQVMPVTRGVDRQEVRLEKGVHTFRFRLNQYSGPWQAYFMIRNRDDGLSGAAGLPLEPAGAGAPAENNGKVE